MNEDKKRKKGVMKRGRNGEDRRWMKKERV